MKLPYRIKFYIWLADTLMRKPMTLEEIQDAWFVSSANIDGTSLSERTFNRYRNDTETMLDIEIRCNSADGYKYSVDRPSIKRDNGAMEWLMSAFRIGNLANSIKSTDIVSVESAPPGSEYLQVIIDAIEKGYYLAFTYQTHFKPAKDVEFIPAFVRLYKQRWYVIGQIKDEDKIRTYAFERISNIDIVHQHVELSEDLQEILTPSMYFENCFGIINRFDPITIRFRAFTPQDHYLTGVPIHSSQTLIEQCDGHSDFEIYVKPTYDLKQEFMWNRDKIAVLSPEWFRQDMIYMIKATLANYETGECHMIDE